MLVVVLTKEMSGENRHSGVFRNSLIPSTVGISLALNRIRSFFCMPDLHRITKRWGIIKDMLERKGLARHQLDSYDDFVKNGIKEIIADIGSIKIENPTRPYTIKFGKVEFRKPKILEADGSTGDITPVEARLRNATYSSSIMVHVDLVENDNTGEEVTFDSKLVYIGELPIMVKSKLCVLRNLSIDKLIKAGEDPNDPGGYFIINGSERIITGVEDVPFNRIMLSKEDIGKTTYMARVYSGGTGFRSKMELIMKDGEIFAKLASSPVDIPIVILLRAMGVKSDRDIALLVSAKPEVQDILELSFELEIRTQNDAKNYLSRRISPGMTNERQNKKTELMIDSILPHLGREPVHRGNKVRFLGEMICRLAELKLGWLNPDDRDHYGNKTVKFGGPLLAEIFRPALRNLAKDVKYQLERTSGQKHSIETLTLAIRPGIITDKINNCMATGNWVRGRAGVTQMLERTNYLANISHLRRIQSPLSRDQPNYAARDLHTTHFGRICPSETPEGSNCGLVKNMAMSGLVSVSVDETTIFDILKNNLMIPDDVADDSLKQNGTRIILNGMLVGYHHNGKQFTKTIRELRRGGAIHPHVGIYFDDPTTNATKRIHINCNAGRLLRPLIIIKDGASTLTDDTLDKVSSGKISWNDLIKNGIIEVIDANEEENCLVAFDEESIKNQTHLEVFASAILGIGPSQIPYPEHNQSPRITYGAAMAKQGVGFSTPTIHTSTYVRQHMMIYPQVPLVDTKSMKIIGMEGRPAGINCVVAVLPFDGYNIEDAIVISKASVDRGLARSFFYRIYKAEARHYGNARIRDSFEVPSMQDNVDGFKGENAYRFLEKDGAVAAESVVAESDILVGRTSPPRFTEVDIGRHFEPKRRDTSVPMRVSERGTVDAVLITTSQDGNKMIKVRTRDMRIPEIGDKFASRHGQKGVCGLLANAEDLPYTKDGTSPDILINPHAFPSRMTVGMLLESICGKAASLRGRRVDGSPFHGEKLDRVKATLEDAGFEYSGKEKMYDGRTGKAFPVDVFIGVVYYQRLQHMVTDKMHARARGLVQSITKQPTEGRARGGGLRFGEMERDCIIAYGASMILKDRLLDESDRTEIDVCKNCGLIAHYDTVRKNYVCRVCGDGNNVVTVDVSYGFKLLLQEMGGLNIAPRIIIKDGL